MVSMMKTCQCIESIYDIVSQTVYCDIINSKKIYARTTTQVMKRVRKGYLETVYTKA